MLRFLNYKLIEYDYTAGGFLSSFHYWFNLIEGIAWFTIGGYVFIRFVRNRKSPYEIIYAILFFLFGMTDFREMRNLPVWLLALKAIILVSLLSARFNLKKNHYGNLKI